MNLNRFKITPVVGKGALAVTAAMAVNVALFSMVTALNRTLDVDDSNPAEDETAFNIQELPPPPEPINVPPKEPEPPKPDVAETPSAASDPTPTPLTPLDLGLADLGGGQMMVNVSGGTGVARTAPAPVEPKPPRVFHRGEVDRPVRPVACATATRPPAVARRRGLSASVRVRAVIDPKGHVQSASAVHASGDRHPSFSNEAVRHFKSCRFQPAQKDGRTVSQWVERVYEFAERG